MAVTSGENVKDRIGSISFKGGCPKLLLSMLGLGDVDPAGQASSSLCILSDDDERQLGVENHRTLSYYFRSNDVVRPIAHCDLEHSMKSYGLHLLAGASTRSDRGGSQPHTVW